MYQQQPMDSDSSVRDLSQSSDQLITDHNFQAPNQNVIDESSVSVNVVLQNTNQQVHSDSLSSQRLPSFHMLVTSIRSGHNGSNQQKQGTLILPALNGLMLDYQPAQVDDASFIEQSHQTSLDGPMLDYQPAQVYDASFIEQSHQTSLYGPMLDYQPAQVDDASFIEQSHQTSLYGPMLDYQRAQVDDASFIEQSHQTSLYENEMKLNELNGVLASISSTTSPLNINCMQEIPENYWNTFEMATNSKDNTDNQSQLLNTTSNSLEEKINPMNSKQHQSIMKRKEFKEISSKTPKKKKYSSKPRRNRTIPRSEVNGRFIVTKVELNNTSTEDSTDSDC